MKKSSKGSEIMGSIVFGISFAIPASLKALRAKIKKT